MFGLTKTEFSWECSFPGLQFKEKLIPLGYYLAAMRGQDAALSNLNFNALMMYSAVYSVMRNNVQFYLFLEKHWTTELELLF